MFSVRKTAATARIPRHVYDLTYSLADQNFLVTKSVGIFNLSVHLLKALAERTKEVRLTVLANSTLQNDLSQAKGVQIQKHEAALGGRLRRIWWDQVGVYLAARQAGNEWLVLPKGFASFARRCPVKLALYVHDTILESYYQRHPGMSRLEMAYFRGCLGASLRQAKVIFTNSEFTKREVERAASRRGLSPPPVHAIGIGFDSLESTGGSAEERIVVLCSVWPHKRTDLAWRYLQRWQEATRYAGAVDWVGSWPRMLLWPKRPNWSHFARLPEPEFRRRVQSAKALVFFSDYEGFGMPPVEAALQGSCPVYSDIEATREVMSGAGFPFTNDSYESFAQALNQALRTSREQVRVWREQLLLRHNWSTTAARFVAALR